MKNLPSFALASLLALPLASGCAAEQPDASSSSSSSSSSTSEIVSARVRLPVGDRCRDVLAPLGLAMAESSVGLDGANAITASLTSETDTRAYTISVAHGAEHYRWSVELDNDSHSMCLLLSVRLDHDAELANDARSPATAEELRVAAPIAVSPADDDCTPVVRLLGQAVATSAVGPSSIDGVDVSLAGATEDRAYAARVDGRSFVVNGTTFQNDYDFSFELSNDSAFKCWVQGVSIE